MKSCVVLHPKHKAVWGILCLGKSTCALWPYWSPLARCSGGGSSGRPGRGRQTCSLQLHSGLKLELEEQEVVYSEDKGCGECWIHLWIRWVTCTKLFIKATCWVFTSICGQCVLNILSRGKEIAREVKRWRVICRDSIIIQSGSIEFMTSLWVHPPMSCIHNMGDS